METAIGVYDSRDRAERAVKDLLAKGVPVESIVFLTRSESEAANFAKEVGGFAGGFLGGTVGMAAGAAAIALALVPGVGQVYALGVGATALFGYLGARGGSAAAKAIAHDEGVPEPTAAHRSEDAATLVEVLKQGHSVIVVRTESPQVATAATAVLDSAAAAAPSTPSKKLRMSTREIDGIAIIDVVGRITIGEGNIMLRQVVTTLMDKGNNRIIVNCIELDHLDSSGIGELVRSHTAVRKTGGRFTLANLTKKIHDLLTGTSLHKVLEIHKDEPTAVEAIRSGSTSGAGA
ncbi:MAG: STAS domain-containing protein [Candidatus Acidiferrales bacterium]